MDGQGTLTTLSGALKDQGYSFDTRFKSADGKAGTNPEELIAAAHAGCYSMAVAFALSKAGTPPQELKCRAEVSLSKNEGGFKIDSIHLVMVGAVAGLATDKFVELAEIAKTNCPISRALSAVPITLDASLS